MPGRNGNRYKKKIWPTALLCASLAAAAAIAAIYFSFISRHIYDDSTDHLGEIYGQVNRSFGAFIERNWGLLDAFGDYIAAGGDIESAAEFIDGEREYWGFSEFYLISDEREFMTLSGRRGPASVDDGAWESLMAKEPVMTGATLEDGEKATVFAVPLDEAGELAGFKYSALAMRYTNADIEGSLRVDAFSGKARCFVIRGDGSVLLSTQAGGGVFANYFSYLKASSDLDGESLERIADDWKNGAEGLWRCSIGGVSYCILYEPTGYQDYMLLSAVPQSAVSAGFLTVQRVTMDVFAVIFLLVGAAAVVVIAVRSRSQSQKARMELESRDRMFDVLSETVDDIFIMINADDNEIDYISPNVERLLGVGADEARKNIRALEKCAVNYNVVIPKDELDAIPINENKYWECEYMHQSTKERRWYRMTIYHMKIENAEKYIVVMSDRTREQQMNQKLQEALDAAKSANEAKSNFLSNMSHDIRTPMNAIVGFSMLLEKDADDADKVREYTRKITASSRHLLSLINDVLDMSKIESGKTSLNIDKFSLPELLEGLSIILMPQAKAKGQSFTTHVVGAPPEVMLGDSLRLNQILINLLSNAIKYTQEGGRIEFTVSELPQPAPQYAKLRFTVKDNGIGMSEEFQKKVFAPFSREINSVTNKIQGTGLGMAITKNLVDLMGGIISVKSKPGDGSTFTVELSFALPEREEGEAWYAKKIARLLVADDEEDICVNIREMMKDTGVEVVYVTGGDAAIDAAVREHEAGRGFDVILLDWKMPGTDGVAASRAIRERVGDGVPILVLTSYDWADIEDEARRAGINAFMPKPFFTSTFWQTVRPFFTDAPAPAAKEESGHAEVMKGRRFLVAEDNELNAEILTEVLGLEGAECELAVNGREAAEMFERSSPGYYDMILMDVQMPVMNGYEATRLIRSGSRPDAKTIPIVAMTANTFAEDVRNALDAGMDGHLGKPIDLDAVRELVGRLLDK